MPPILKEVFFIFFNMYFSDMASLVAEMVKNLAAVQETGVRSLGQEDPPDKEMATNPVYLPGEFHEQRSLAGYRQRGHRESDTTERLTLSLSDTANEKMASCKPYRIISSFLRVVCLLSLL